MPIRALELDTVTQICRGCGMMHSHELSRLTVGVGDGDRLARTIALPPCRQCGAQEFLVQYPNLEDHPVPGSVGHRHRLLVNHLHAELSRRGTSATSGEGPVAVPVPAALLKRWFPDGLRIDDLAQ